MKFKLMVNGHTPLYMFISYDYDHELWDKINRESDPAKKAAIAFNALKRRLKGNFRTIHPVGFVS